MGVKYITLLDGRVVPWLEGTPLPSNALTPGSNSGLLNPMATQYDDTNTLPSKPTIPEGRFNRGDKPMYGAPGFFNKLIKNEQLAYPNDPVLTGVGEINKAINNIFGEYDPGGVGTIGGGNRRVGPRDLVTLPNGKQIWVDRDTSGDWFPDTSYADRAMFQADYKNPNAPNYVKPPTNLLNVDFGGTGALGMSGEGAFTTPFTEAFSSDIPRFVDDLNKLKGLKSEGILVDAEVEAHLKLLTRARGGKGMGSKEIMYLDPNAQYTRNTYIFPFEVANKIGVPTTITDEKGQTYARFRNQAELIAAVDKKLFANKEHSFTKKTFDMGGTGAKGSINVSEVGDLFKKNIDEKAKERQALIDAKKRLGVGESFFDQAMGIFSPDPYDDYVDDKGRTTRGDYLKREDLALLKKEGILDTKEVAKTGPAFSKKEAYGLLGMYLTMNRLMSREEPPTISSIAGSPAGLKLDVPDLYKKRRI